MIPIKTAGRIVGAKLTNAERKALDIEIFKQFAEFENRHALEIESMVLYTLMAGYGWKEKRLHDFWNRFRKIHAEMIKRYELSAGEWDDAFVCTQKMKEQGIDISTWEQELEAND